MSRKVMVVMVDVDVETEDEAEAPYGLAPKHTGNEAPGHAHEDRQGTWFSMSGGRNK